MRLSSIACVATLMFAACGDDNDDLIDAELEVVNDSDFTITELFLTDVGSSTWGSDLLRGDVLFPDESFVLGVSCGTYDALLVDETGVECELNSLDLCFNNATWVIQNNTCTVFARQAPEENATTQVPATQIAK